MDRKSPILTLALVAICCTTVSGQLTVRIVDVGAGLCCVAQTSDRHYMIYDAGNYLDRGETAMVAIEQLIPIGSTIDLLVLSHCDADHIAAVPFICENYKVKEVWRDGFNSGRETWLRADDAVRREARDEGCEDNNLQVVDVEPGYSVEVGNATVTFLCGFADIPTSWGLRSEGEDKNARSVVVRMDYGDSSIMFSGDTVGRHIGDSWNTNIAAERFLVDNRGQVPIDIDVLIAPHHGADNGSSYPFIRATSPEYVIFSAGSRHQHPHYWTANRYTASGVSRSKMFRTDRGDNEGGNEWSVGGGSQQDPTGDDDVEITADSLGNIGVEYVSPLGFFETRTFAFDGVERTEVVRVRSPQVAKWVENDALWQDKEEDLEAHTIPTTPLARMEHESITKPFVFRDSCRCRCKCFRSHRFGRILCRRR